MIQLNNIHKSFNDVEVIKGIDLSVEQGEVVTLIGRLVQANNIVTYD